MTRADILAAVAALASGYLIGGVPFGYLAARLRGVDIRAVGSGNIGSTNVGRALGRAWGSLVLVLDIAKGLAPVILLAPFVAGQMGSGNVELARVATGAGAILGHVLTPYLALRGGKGVATSIGVFAPLCSYWIGIPLAAYVLMRKLTGFVSAGSIALAVLLPAAAWLAVRREAAGGWLTVGFAGAAGVLILVRHSSNIARLVRGTEHAAPSGRSRGADRAAPGDASPAAGEREAT